MPNYDYTGADAVIIAVQEMDRQDIKWGQQNHPMHPNDTVEPSYQSIYASFAEEWKQINDNRVQSDRLGWDGILCEEVYEALSADTIEDQITELSHVAAVALQAMVSLKRQQNGE